MSEMLWTSVALGYALAGIYLCAFDNAKHPLWVWTPFLMVSGAIFLLINGSYFWGPETTVLQYIEYFAIVAIAIAGAAMFRLALAYAEHRNELESYRHRNQTTLNDHEDDDND